MYWINVNHDSRRRFLSSNKSIDNRQRLFDKRNRGGTSRTLHFHFHCFIPWLHTLSRFFTYNIYHWFFCNFSTSPTSHPFIIPSYRPVISLLLYPSNLLILRSTPSLSLFSRSPFSRSQGLCCLGRCFLGRRSVFSRSSFSRHPMKRTQLEATGAKTRTVCFREASPTIAKKSKYCIWPPT